MTDAPDPFDLASIRIDPRNPPPPLKPLPKQDPASRAEFASRPRDDKDRLTPTDVLGIIAEVIDGESDSMFDAAVSDAAAELYPLVDGGLAVCELTDLVAAKFIELYDDIAPLCQQYLYAIAFAGRFDLHNGLGCYIEFEGTALVCRARSHEDWGVPNLTITKQRWHYPENWSDHPSSGRLRLFSTTDLQNELAKRADEEKRWRAEEAAAYDPELDAP